MSHPEIVHFIARPKICIHTRKKVHINKRLEREHCEDVDETSKRSTLCSDLHICIAICDGYFNLSTFRHFFPPTCVGRPIAMEISSSVMALIFSMLCWFVDKKSLSKVTGLSLSRGKSLASVVTSNPLRHLFRFKINSLQHARTHSPYDNFTGVCKHLSSVHINSSKGTEICYAESADVQLSSVSTISNNKAGSSEEKHLIQGHSRIVSAARQDELRWSEGNLYPLRHTPMHTLWIHFVLYKFLPENIAWSRLK